MQPLDDNNEQKPTNSSGESSPSNEPAHPDPAAPSNPGQPAEPAPKPITNPDEDQPSEALTFEEEVEVDKAIERAEENKLDREAVLADIIRRIHCGEPAMLVFCTEHDVPQFEAFPLMEAEGRLVIDEYEDDVPTAD